MTKDEALRLAFEALESSRRTHYYCEDTWYSCPKHEDGCANDSEGDECNCGADKANAEIDQAITAIKSALEAKYEPVTENGMYRLGYHNGYGFGEAYGKANAPQRKPLTDEEITEIFSTTKGLDFYLNFARAIEAAHGIIDPTDLKGKA